MEKHKRHIEELDSMAWLMGQYFISSIQKALDPKKAKYPEHPHGINNTEKTQNPIIAAKRFEDFVNVFNKKFQTKTENGTQ